MRDDEDDEYVDAFQRFVAGLFVQTLLHQRPAAVDGSGEKGARMPKMDKRKRRTPMPAVLSPGAERDEEVQLRLRRGQSFVGLASFFDRTPEFMIREAKRLLGEYELKRLIKRNKKGQWSNDEVNSLISLRKRDLGLAQIAMWLRRTKQSVKKQLREVESTVVEPAVVEGPQQLPPGFEESLFNTRLIEVW